jgi:hypothetical protein
MTVVPMKTYDLFYEPMTSPLALGEEEGGEWHGDHGHSTRASSTSGRHQPTSDRL